MATDFSNIGPTCQKIADMMQFGREIVDKWPRFYRDDLGLDIKREMREMLRLATKARLKYYNKTTLQELDTEKEILKIYLREANATKFHDKRGEQRKLLSDHTYGVWSEKVVEIGRLVGGWISSIKNEKDGEKSNPARRQLQQRRQHRFGLRELQQPALQREQELWRSPPLPTSSKCCTATHRQPISLHGRGTFPSGQPWPVNENLCA